MVNVSVGKIFNAEMDFTGKNVNPPSPCVQYVRGTINLTSVNDENHILTVSLCSITFYGHAF